MKGDNGLTPGEQLAHRNKCPEHPTKRQITTLVEAEAAAAEASKKARRTIVPYACGGCGYYHVTGKTAGSDVVHAGKGGTIKTAAMEIRESTYVRPTVAERVEVVPDEVIPSNVAARRKMLLGYLADKTQVSTDEVGAVLHASRHTVWKYMTELGWKSSRGPGAMWRPPAPTLTVVEGTGQSTGDDELEAAILRHPSSRAEGWWQIDAFPPNVSVHDYLLTLKTAGLEVRVQARRLP